MALSLADFQTVFLNKGISFVSYRKPGSLPKTNYLTTLNEVCYQSIDQLNTNSGFLLAPFKGESSPIVFFPNDQILEGWFSDREIIKNLPDYGNFKQFLKHDFAPEPSRQDYKDQISKTIIEIEKGEAHKVVLSRTKLFSTNDIISLPYGFTQLCDNYPDAFVFLVASKYGGVWLGATPEELIKVKGNIFQTMALAATREAGTLIDWNLKEYEEQAYVASFMRHRLTMANIPFNESERKTVKAGNLEHLQTIFTGSILNENQGWKDIVNEIYPTPAICGTGNGQSLKIIQEKELHKREYYTGFLGTLEMNGDANLFINLRCLKWLGNQIILYAGGGILLESDPEAEWVETELKMDTLLKIITRK